MKKQQFDAELLQDLSALLDGETHFIAALANASALLYERLEGVNWAGFYLLDGDILVLGPFQGKVACMRIPLGKGVCGRAVQRRKTAFSVSAMCMPLRAISPVTPPVMLKSYCLSR